MSDKEETMHHFHSTKTAPATEGKLIRWAAIYNVVTRPLLKSSEPKILKLAEVKPGDSVLDAGCGPGSLALRAKTLTGAPGKVYGIDASPEMIEVARREAMKKRLEVDFQNAVIEALPIPDNSLDVVVSRLVIHHLPNDLKLKGFKEMYRVLKPGGYCLIADFDFSGHLSFGGILGKLTHMRLDRNQSLIQTYVPLLQEAGFRGIETGKVGSAQLGYVRGRKSEV